MFSCTLTALTIPRRSRRREVHDYSNTFPAVMSLVHSTIRAPIHSKSLPAVMSDACGEPNLAWLD